MLKVKPSRRVQPRPAARLVGLEDEHPRSALPRAPRRSQTGQTGTHHDHIRIGSHASFDAGPVVIVTTSLVGGLRGS